MLLLQTLRSWGPFDLTHSVPLSADVLGGEVGVRVDSGQLDAVGLGDLQDLVVDAQSGHALLVGLGQSSLELVVSCDQTLCGRKTNIRWRISVCFFVQLLPLVQI